jgi:hypothetical protein
MAQVISLRVPTPAEQLLRVALQSDARTHTSRLGAPVWQPAVAHGVQQLTRVESTNQGGV